MKDFVEVSTHRKGWQRARVVKENAKTLIVDLPDGNRIKRHRRKHVAIFGTLASTRIIERHA